MAAPPTSAKGVRLPDDTWEAIDQAAAALGMSRNEFLKRRLSVAFSAVPKVRKSDESNQNADLASAFREDS